VSLLTTTKTCEVSDTKIKLFVAFYLLVILLSSHIQEFAEPLGQHVVSLNITIVIGAFFTIFFIWAANLSVRPLTFCLHFPAPSTYSFPVQALSLPNNTAVVRVVRSLISDMLVSSGYQLLSRHFKILTLSSLLSNTFSKTYQVIDNVSEPFLHVCNGLSLLHSEQLIVLDQCMLLCTLDISFSFMSYFKNVPRFHCRSTLRYLEIFIKIQGRSYNVLGHTVVLRLLALNIITFNPSFFCSFSIDNSYRHKRIIHKSIPNTMVYWFNKNLHSYFPNW